MLFLLSGAVVPLLLFDAMEYARRYIATVAVLVLWARLKDDDVWLQRGVSASSVRTKHSLKKEEEYERKGGVNLPFSYFLSSFV